MVLQIDTDDTQGEVTLFRNDQLTEGDSQMGQRKQQPQSTVNKSLEKSLRVAPPTPKGPNVWHVGDKMGVTSKTLNYNHRRQSQPINNDPLARKQSTTSTINAKVHGNLLSPVSGNSTLKANHGVMPSYSPLSSARKEDGRQKKDSKIIVVQKHLVQRGRGKNSASTRGEPSQQHQNQQQRTNPYKRRGLIEDSHQVEEGKDNGHSTSNQGVQGFQRQVHGQDRLKTIMNQTQKNIQMLSNLKDMMSSKKPGKMMDVSSFDRSNLKRTQHEDHNNSYSILQ